MVEQPSTRRVQTICLLVLSTATVVFCIYWLRPVLVPFVVSVFVVCGVEPILQSLEQRLNVNRLIAAVITFLVGLAIMVVFAYLLVGSVLELLNNAAAYRKRVRELTTAIEQYIPERFLGIPQFTIPESNEKKQEKGDAAETDQADATPTGSQSLASEATSSKATNSKATDSEATNSKAPDSERSDPDRPGAIEPDPAAAIPSSTSTAGNETSNEGSQTATGLDGENGAEETPKEREDRERDMDRQRAETFVDNIITDGISQISTALQALVSTTVVVLIYVFFLLLGTPDSTTRSPAWDEIEEQIRSYLGLKTVISAVTGFAFGFALYLFGVPMATTFGVLAFLLNYIPNIGPIVASVLPIPLIVLHPEATWWWAIMVIAITSGIQVVSGSIVEPKMMGESSDLHPVVVLLALMFWGMMWGIVGMFLATPITALVKMVLAKYETTRGISEIMAGRWETEQPSEPPPETEGI